MKKKFLGYMMIAPVTAGCLLFYIIPFFLVIQHSLSVGYGESKTFSGLLHFQKLLNNEMFLLAFGNTMRFLAVGLPLIMIVSYLTALLLQKCAGGKYKFLRSVFLLPYIIPVVGTVLLVQLLFAQDGLINTQLYTLGLPVVKWLESPYSFFVILGLYLWKNFGYSTVLLLAGLVTIPEEQYSAADLDGAREIQKFLYIITPQMWHTVLITVVFSAINAFKCFREIFLIGGEHPDRHVYMLQHFINNSFQNFSYPKLAAGSVLFFGVVVIFFAVLYIWINHKSQGGEQ